MTLFAKSYEKHLVIEWLPWSQSKRYLINITYYEAIMDEPIPYKTFTLVGQGSHEIPEEVPPPLESYVGTYTKGKTFTK